MLAFLIVPLVLKSALVAGAALLLLQFGRLWSPSRRSFIAHFALGALVLLPLAATFMPNIEIAAPRLFEAAGVSPLDTNEVITQATAPTIAAADPSLDAAPAASVGVLDSIDPLLLLYALPAALLLGMTFVALVRLAVLQGRAQVLIEPHWLSALALAQRRMGFKHGTALLSSGELSSPISWGLVRPVILLNDGALGAAGEAEAIIAHELAHVAHFDWLKLLVARIAVALFWFNPLVWLLAREAHQLREEAADDAVLGSDVDDTDYAQLLVGFARHDGRGALIAAHGVAPARDSLRRRVRRVLDRDSVRGPVGWRWAIAAFVAGAALTAPLTALVLVPTTSAALDAAAGQPTVSANAPTAQRSVGLPGVAFSSAPSLAELASVERTDPAVRSTRSVRVDTDRVDIDAKDLAEIGKASSELVSFRALIAAKIHGVTPLYARQIADAAPHWPPLSQGQLTTFRIHHVTPQYIRDLRAAGFASITPGQIVAARIQGVDLDYVRSMRRAGVATKSLSQVTQLKILGVGPADVGANNGKPNLRVEYGPAPFDIDPDPDPDPDPDDDDS